MIAAVLEIPDIWWQATHGWATIAMTQSLNQNNGGAANIGVWIIGQLIVLGLVRVWGAVAGIRFLWKSGRPLWKALVWAYALLFVTFMLTTGAQIYYVTGTYVFLLAAGAVALDGWLAARRSRMYRFVGGLTVSALVFVPFLLPVLPIADANVTSSVFPVQNQTVGWPQLVSTVREVWFSLPAQQRANAVIYADDFGRPARSTSWAAAPVCHRGQRARHRVVVGAGQPARHHRGRGDAGTGQQQPQQQPQLPAPVLP